MKAALLTHFGSPHTIIDLDIDPPGPGEVMLRVQATGVCRSDLSTALGHLPHPLPCVLGHEAAGIIESVGAGVSSVAVGDHVIVLFRNVCGACFFCVRGQPSLCEHNPPLGTFADGSTRLFHHGKPVFHGMNTATFAERTILSERAVLKIPDRTPFDVAAVIGCAGITGYGACNRAAQVTPGQSIAVLGCGGVGLNVVQAARFIGATPIVAIDKNKNRLRVAEAMGATHRLTISESTVDEVRRLTGGRGVDVSFEAAGDPSLQTTAVEVARKGGRVVFVGLPAAGVATAIETFRLICDGKTLIGCFYGSAQLLIDLKTLCQLSIDGRLAFEPLISHRMPLEAINDAFQLLTDGIGIRTVLLPH